MVRLADFDTEDQETLRQARTPARPDRSLLSFANENKLRVTSGFSKGGHNRGSKHYQGDELHPGAVDIASMTPAQIKLAQAQGYRVVDETRRPKGQAVWTGPHYHLEVANTPAGPVAITKPNVPTPSAQVGRVQMPDLGRPLGRPFTTNDQGTLVRANENKQDIGKAVQKANAPISQGIKDRQVSRVSVQDFEPEDQEQVADIVARLRKPAPKPVIPLQAIQEPETSFMGDLAAGATFGATAGRVDNPRGHGVGNFIGESLGPLLPTGLGALAGTAIGGPIGGIIGGAGAGGATFAGIEEARQRAAGQTPDIGKIALEGGIGAVSSALPILRGGRLATQIAKNAALSGGIEGLGSVARQSMDGKGIDLGRTLSDAGQGAVFGGALGAVFGKVHAKHPEIAAKLEANEPLQPNELAKVKQILDPAELQQLQESWRSRTVGETPKIETGPFNEQDALDDILNKPGVEQVSDSGVLAAREMGKREVPTIEPGRALPEGQAIELGKPGVRSSSILDPQTGKPFEPETTYLRSSKDIALEKAQQVGRDSGVILSPERDLGRPGGPPSPRPAIDLGRPVEGSRPGILDPQGRAIGEAPRDVSLTEPMPEARPLLDAQGRELGRPTAQPQELGRPDTTSAIAPEADTFTPQGATPEQTSTLRQELEQQVQQRGGQLMKIADAEQFMRGRSGQQHGLNFLEAGRNNQQIDISYTPLGEGRANTKTRTISPFGIERRVIKPGTELNNLKRQFGSYAAVRDHLIQKAREAGQTVNAGSITTKPASLKAAIERLGMNEHVYLHSHNFGETTVGTGKSERGYRLDTITDSSLTGQKANIPVGAYQNEIAPALQALDQLASLEGAPPLFKRAVTQIQKGEISSKTVKELKAALSDDSGLAAQFCKTVGIKL